MTLKKEHYFGLGLALLPIIKIVAVSTGIPQVVEFAVALPQVVEQLGQLFGVTILAASDNVLNKKK